MKLRFRDRALGHLIASAALALAGIWLSVELGVADALSPEQRQVVRGALARGAVGGLLASAALAGWASSRLAADLRALLHNLSRFHRGASALPEDELDGLVGSVERMSADLTTAVGELSEEKGRLEAVLDGLQDALFTLDRGRRIGLVNPAAGRMLGWSEPPVGRTLLEVLRLPELSRLADLALAGEAASGELDLLGPGVEAGRRGARVLVTATPQVGGGCVLVLHDVSDLRRLETMRRDFVANVSHELRTPVSAVRASAEALSDGALTDEVLGPQMVEAIERNAVRLSALIEDLLTLSRMEAGHYELHLTQVSVRRVVRQAQLGASARVEQKGHALSSHVPDHLRVVADAKALEQVLVNLLENAAKYTQDGGNLEVRASRDGERVRIEVLDDGPGVPPRYRARLFERFYRVDPGRSRDMGGTGLGLAIVKHLVELMGGAVGMEPRRPRGSIFWVSLQAASNDASMDHTHATSPG